MDKEESQKVLTFFSNLVMGYGGKLDKVAQEPFFTAAAAALNVVKRAFDANQPELPEKSDEKE